MLTRFCLRSRAMNELSGLPASRCVDAFIIALSQATGEGKDKRWYVSTLQLQMLSLLFCRECRSVPRLHVKITDETPRRMWASREPPDYSLDTPAQAGGTSRVPFVQALEWTWALPRVVVFQGAVTGPSGRPEKLRLATTSMERSPEPVGWPPGLKRLVLETNLEATLEAVMWPTSLQELSFGCFLINPSPALLGQPVCDS